jgi:hypothetical protein
MNTLLCFCSFILCSAVNLHIDESRVNKIVIKIAHLGTTFEEEVHMTRFFWNYEALSSEVLKQKELINRNEIHAFCSMLSNLKEETPQRPIYRQGVSMSPNKINARDCLVPYLLNHQNQNDLPRCNHFIDALQVTVKVEIYSDNSTRYSVIWGGGFMDYKKKRYILSSELSNYFWEIYFSNKK